MKKKLGRLSLESFDQAPTGNVRPLAQPETPPQPLVPTAGYSETPFSGEENYAAESNQADQQVALLWKTLLAYYKRKGDEDLVETLNPGASLTEINKLETRLHAKLPQAYVALLELADGQDLSQSHDADHQIFGHRIFNSVDYALAQSEEFTGWDRRAWDMYRERDTGKGVQDVDFSAKWLVFGGSREDDNKPSILVMDFDPTHEGTMGQIVSIDLRGNRRVVVGQDFLTWFQRFVGHLTTTGHSALATESLSKPAYPLRKALEATAQVVDVDDLDQLAVGANSLSTYLTSSAPEVAMESEKNASDIAKSKMHLRFKKLKDGFVDTFRSAAGMAAKYEKTLNELEEELLKGHTHGQIKVDMTGLWQHFSDEKGPITHNLLGKVREDVAFSTYILTVFSHEAYEQLEHLSRALHTGQGTSDEQALRTAQDVEKLKGPAEYLDQKWVCAAGEQPYLSVTGLSVQQGRHPRTVGIAGSSLDKLSQLATPYHVREFGSFLHGMKKLFRSDIGKTTHMAADDLSKLIAMGREYVASAKTYLEIYNRVWPIFRKIDDALDLIWDDFDLVEYEVEAEDDLGNKETTTWTESGTGPIHRRAAVFDQLMQVVRNFADAVMQPGVNELARALRAAKFHGYLVAAGIKAAEGHGQNAGNVAQELFGFGKKEAPAPKTHAPIKASLEKLLTYSNQHQLELQFRKPNPQAIAKVEQMFGEKLPTDFHELYSFCNGQERGPGWIFGDDLMACEEIMGRYGQGDGTLKGHEPDPGEDDDDGKLDASHWQHPKWLPFTDAGNGDWYGIDMAPGAKGRKGQIVSFAHDDEGRHVAAESLTAFISIAVDRFIEYHQKKAAK